MSQRGEEGRGGGGQGLGWKLTAGEVGGAGVTQVGSGRS